LAGEESADLVLCHGVLEVVDEPSEALTAIHRVLRSGGLASVIVSGRPAAVLARALSGDLVRAQELLAANVQYAQTRRDGVHREGPRRYTHDEAAALLHDHRFTVERIESARLFADLVSSALVDS